MNLLRLILVAEHINGESAQPPFCSCVEFDFGGRETRKKNIIEIRRKLGEMLSFSLIY
jgi:hypothetical protein